MTHVLVVDDDEDTSALLAVLFHRQGWKTTFAADLVNARGTLDAGEVSALVTDVTLPDGSGLTLLADGRPGFLRAAIVITGSRSEQQRSESVLRGFDACVTKPFDGAALVDLLARLLARDLQTDGPEDQS